MAKKTRRKKYTTEEIAEALEKYNGYVYLAADHLGCTPKTIYRRLETVGSLVEKLESIRGKELDVTEMALHRAIMEGESWAVQFKLKTQGKHRGYVERQEITGADGGAIEFDDARKSIQSKLSRLATGNGS